MLGEGVSRPEVASDGAKKLRQFSARPAVVEEVLCHPPAYELNANQSHRLYALGGSAARVHLLVATLRNFAKNKADGSTYM